MRSPSWALDSLLLRRALAETNVPAVLAIVRSAAGLSQRDMAAVAGWSPAAQSYYERGRRDAVFDIRVLLQFADAMGMPRVSLLALVLGDPGAAAIETADGLCGTMTSSAPRPGTPVVADEARLRYWRVCADVLYSRMAEAGSAEWLRPALLLWDQVRNVPGNQESADVAFSAVAAGIALCAAEFALDSGDLPLARSLHAAARGFAARAGNTMLDVQALVAGSRLHVEAARAGSRDAARLAMVLARKADEESRYLPVPELHVLVALRQADAAALLGDAVLFRSAIARARRDLDRPWPDSIEPCPAWLRKVDHGYVAALEKRYWAPGTGSLTVSAKAVQAAEEKTSARTPGRAESRIAQPAVVAITSTH